MQGRGGEGGEAEEGRDEKAVDKDFATCPQGHICSKSRHGREDKGRQGQGREEGETSPIVDVDGRPSKAVGTTKVLGHGRLRVTEARIPAAQAGLGISASQPRVPIVRVPHSPRRGWGGVGSFRGIPTVFFLFLFGTASPPPWLASEPSARTLRWWHQAARHTAV